MPWLPGQAASARGKRMLPKKRRTLTSRPRSRGPFLWGRRSSTPKGRKEISGDSRCQHPHTPKPQHRTHCRLPTSTRECGPAAVLQGLAFPPLPTKGPRHTGSRPTALLFVPSQNHTLFLCPPCCFVLRAALSLPSVSYNTPVSSHCRRSLLDDEPGQSPCSMARIEQGRPPGQRHRQTRL